MEVNKYDEIRHVNHPTSTQT